jgi:DNA excision repair protein ERCC-2
MTDQRQISISVRDLVEFVLRTGDLGGKRDFVGPLRAWEGTRGHQRIQKSRPLGYETEVALAHEIATPEFVLRVQGRIDGILPTSGKVLIEEIKTITGSWDKTADPLHWAQAKIYAFIYAHDHALEHLDIQLTYLHLDSGELTEFHQSFTRVELASFFTEVVEVYLVWARQHQHWCQLRDQSIQSLAFPHSTYRAGQRELAVAAYRTMARGGKLFVEAPTGIGKTISVLFPAVKAMGEGKLEKIFYLTARTVGRAVAEKACADLRQAGLRLRTLTLTAKDKICFNNGQPCDMKTCPFALGYYDRIKAAMRDALSRQNFTRTTLEELARRHQVCPFALSLDLSLWVDAIICDYNYVFDPQAYLRRYFDEEKGDYVFLIDEAHNLVDRARDMFSAELSKAEILEVKRAVQPQLPACAKALNKIHSAWVKFVRSFELEDEGSPSPRPSPPGEGELFSVADKLLRHPEFVDFDNSNAAPDELPLLGERAGVRASVRQHESLVTKQLPEALLPLLRDFLKEAESWLVQNHSASFREPLLELYFSVTSFVRTAELHDERYVTIFDTTTPSRLHLFCLDPSHLIQQALKRGNAAVFFSGTLTPMDYFREILGGDEQDDVLQLASPFPPENLGVFVEDRIATSFRERASSYDEVAQAISALVQGKRGNYLIYFPSYKYLNSVRERFGAQNPQAMTLVQTPAMTESERDNFLAAFHCEHQQTLVGFAVMGGIFGEGIDLVGDRLAGVVVVGVGLPQLCLERDLIRDYFQSAKGAGFDFAYTFPGMNRVLQAVGRVIRTETDRGVALLIDQRFKQTRYRKLFPACWRPCFVRGAPSIAKSVGAFWNGSEK